MKLVKSVTESCNNFSFTGATIHKYEVDSSVIKEQ